MGVPGIKLHKWNDADDAALMAAYERYDEFAVLYRNNGVAQVDATAWSAVAGLLVLDGILVTGRAAKARWRKLQKATLAKSEEARARADVEALLDEAEEHARVQRGIAGAPDDDVLAALARIEDAIGRLCDLMHTFVAR